jgi:hypothetical protein
MSVMVDEVFGAVLMDYEVIDGEKFFEGNFQT